MFALCELEFIEGVVDNNPLEEGLGLLMMEEAEIQQEQALQRQLEAEKAKELVLQEQIRQQQLEEQKRQQYQNYMGQGNAFMNVKQYKLAIEQYNLALMDYPNDLMAKFNIACCFENMDNIPDAYNIFMELLYQGAQVVGLPDHITHCENFLTAKCTASLKYAQEAYDQVLHSEAIQHLNVARSNVPRSNAGQALLNQIEKLTARMHWDEVRSDINAIFTNGTKALAELKFDVAVESFTDCQTQYTIYADFLYPEDKDLQNQSAELLEFSLDAVKIQKNRQLQNDINDILPSLREDLNLSNAPGAIVSLNKIIELCKQITDPYDVRNLQHIPLNILQDSLTTLSTWQEAFEARKENGSLGFAETIVIEINDITPLSHHDNTELQPAIQTSIKERWHVLDRRDLGNLKIILRGVIQNNIGQYNCLMACAYGVPNYIENIDSLTTEIKGSIANNIPADWRAPIELEMFSRQVQIVTATAIPMIFSDATREGTTLPIIATDIQAVEIGNKINIFPRQVPMPNIDRKKSTLPERKLSM